MKISFIAPHIKISGGVRAMMNYAHLLSLRGHEVEFIISVEDWKRRWAGNILNIKPIWFKDFRPKIQRVPSYNERYIPDSDIVVATAWQTAEQVSSYSKSKGKKFYLIQHYESLYHGEPEKVDRTYTLPLNKIVISTWLQEIMRDKFKSGSHLITTPVDLSLFKYKENLKREAPLRVLMLDHVFHWKGVDKGCKAFSEVKKEYPGIKLIGFGVRRKTPGLEYDEYFYNPKQEKLADIYSSCHIYLCPSEYEGLGMPPMEAMACKCALVTFDTGGSRDYAKDRETAFVARHNDSEDLILKLKMAIGDNELRCKIAESGYDFVRSNFSWQKAAIKMENLFKNA